MQKDILLSICIPTFNRANFLKEAIDSITTQINETNKDLIEIVVSDNASTDDTRESVSEIKKSTQVKIVYSKNDENIGFDKNCLKVVEMASGKYCWLLGDDDLLSPSAIYRIINEVDNFSFVDIFLLNKEEFDENAYFYQKLNSGLNVLEDTIYDFNKYDILEYIKQAKNLVALFGYISAQVFKKEKWCSVREKDKFIGTNYIHVYIFMAILWKSNKGILKYLAERLVKQRINNDRFPNGPAYIDRLKLDVVYYRLFAENIFIDKKCVRQIDRVVIKSGAFSQTVNARIYGGFDFYKKAAPLLIRTYWYYAFFWIKIFPIYFLPIFLLKTIRYIYRNKKRIKLLNNL